MVIVSLRRMAGFPTPSISAFNYVPKARGWKMEHESEDLFHSGSIKKFTPCFHDIWEV